jgi:Holliday junction resolvasome RuvABC ATP-dependent DNA helicase subunit
LKHGNAKSHFTLSGAITISETISSTETQRFGAISSANSFINSSIMEIARKHLKKNRY